MDRQTGFARNERRKDVDITNRQTNIQTTRHTHKTKAEKM
jgi:hypothetical protein